jgi:hypothetical protein
MIIRVPVAAQLDEPEFTFAVDEDVDRGCLLEDGVLLVGDVVASDHDHRVGSRCLDPRRDRHGMRAVPEVHRERDHERRIRVVREHGRKQRRLPVRGRRRDVLVHLDPRRHVRSSRHSGMEITECRAVAMLVEQRHFNQVDRNHSDGSLDGTPRA